MELASASAFAEEGFDAREWVEAVLASASASASSDVSVGGGQGGGGVEGVVSSVSMRLQLLAQELNGELEKGLLDLVASFPRAMAELDKLDLSAQDLRAGLAQVLGGVNEAGKKTASTTNKDEAVVGKEKQKEGLGPEQQQQGERDDDEDPVAVLARLHQVKARMSACRATLHEAARWHQLVREANAGFANGELGLLASVLGQMRASLPVLAHMPEAEDRRRTLLRFEEALQALLKPQVASAMNKEAVGALQELALLYRKLGTISTLHAEYARARPAPLHRTWFASFNPTQDTFPQWLPGFYKRVGEVWAEERRRCREVFGSEEAPAVLARLMVETFTPLAESYHQRLLLKPNDDDAAVNDGGGDVLPFPTVVSLFVQTAEFLAAACSTAHLSPFPLSPPPSASADGPDVPSGMITPSVLAPYVPFLDAYEAREASALQAWLLHAKTRVGTSLEEGDALSAFAESVLDDATAAFPLAGTLAARSLQFSHGYHARQLLSLLDQFLTGDASRLAHAVRLARRRCGLVGGRGPSPVPPSARQEVVSAVPAPAGAFDWDDLQGALRLLQAAGRHAAALRALEKEVAAVLAQMHEVLFGGASGALSASFRLQNPHTSSSPAASSNTTPDAIALHWARDRLLSDQTRAAETRAFLRAVVAAGGGGCGGSGEGGGASGPPIPLPGEAHRLLFDLCMQPVRSRTRTMAELPVWAQQASASSSGWDAAGGGGDAFYSSLPQPYITQVGEHILSLIQQLEDFAASDALAEVAVVAPPGVIERLAEPEWRAAAVALGLNDAETSSLLGTLHTASSSQDTTTEGEEDREELALRFCNGWLLAVARAAAAALVGGACAISGLTAAGARQMHTDAAYLLTVLQNLEVPPPPLLEALRDMCGLLQEEGEGGKARVVKVAEGEEGEQEEAMGLRAARRWLARRLAAAWGSVGGP